MFRESYYFNDGGTIRTYTHEPVVPNIKKIYFNNRHTTVLWSDGKRTTVGCMKGEHFDEYAGLTAAICKRIYGRSAVVKRILETCKEVQPPKKKPKEHESLANAGVG